MTSAKLSSMRFVIRIVLRLVSTIVLSRLLAPENYGVFAIVLAYMFLLEMFSDLGLRSLILTQEGEVTHQFLRTCWAVSILRGIVILILSCLLAFVISDLQLRGMFTPESPYAAESLPLVFVAISLGSLIFGFETPMRFVSERQMAFGWMTAADVCRDMLTLVVTIILAYSLRSVWALAFGHMFRSCLHVILGFVIFGRPGEWPWLDRSELSVLLNRGKWVLTHSSLTALSQHSDRILLGFMMSSTTFGFYYIARQLADVIPQFLTAMNGQMGLQVFTHLHQQNLEDFRRNYYRYRLVFDAVAGLAAGGAIVLAPLIVEIVFDDRYREVAPIMQVLVLSVLLFGPLIMLSAFTAERNFRRTAILNFLSTAALWIGLSLAIFVFASISGALLVVALHKLPEAVLVICAGHRRGWIRLWREPIVLAFFALGAGFGWVILQFWSLVA